MKVLNDTLKIKTEEPFCFVKITEKIEAAAKKSGIKNGFLVLTTQHTTTSICINEECSRLQEDMKQLLKTIVPPAAKYRHNEQTVDNRENAHSHLMSLLLKTSEIVQIQNGEIAIGDWQDIFFIELDGPRSERVIKIMIIGE